LAITLSLQHLGRQFLGLGLAIFAHCLGEIDCRAGEPTFFLPWSVSGHFCLGRLRVAEACANAERAREIA